MNKDNKKHRLKINRKVENIISLSILVLTVIVYLAFNKNYLNSVKEEKTTYVKTAISESDAQILNALNTVMKDVNIISSLIANEGNDSLFDDYTKLYKLDLSYVEYVGILRNSELSKVYYPNGQVAIDKNELMSNYDKIGYYETPYNSDLDFFITSNNDVCCVCKEPIYVTNGEELSYYGEVIFKADVTKIMTRYFQPSIIENANKCGWRVYISFDYGSDMEIYNSQATEIESPIKYKTNREMLNFTYEVSDKILNVSDKTTVGRIILAIIIGGILAGSIKILLYTFRKIGDMKKVNDTKLDFFTNIVYEVRTSTNSIIGLCNEAENENVISNVKSYIVSSKNELNKLLRKINNLLDITNISEGKLKSWEEDYYIHMLIKELENEYKLEAEDKEIKFMTEIAPDIPIKFRGSKIVIKKAIEHIIDNAFNLIIDGHIKINVYGTYVDDTHKVNELKIVISDTEIGMKNDVLNDIQISNALSRTKNDDSKIELAIAHEMLKSIGGKLSINSEFGKGTVYTLVIPQKVIDERIMTEDMLMGLEEKFRGNLGKLKKVNANILVVDDNEVNLSVLKNIINIYGAEVDSVKSGAAAIDLASTKNYDLFFIDYFMPEMDGIETLQKIRTLNRKYRTVPAVLVSANSESREQDVDEGGFDEYLPKPISQNDVERCLKTLLDIELIECEGK
ncbi:MAG: response regulator [Clostridia bacterium]|nr:response regulator [Clostridia bacterium]